MLPLPKLLVRGSGRFGNAQACASVSFMSVELLVVRVTDPGGAELLITVTAFCWARASCGTI